MRLVVDTNIWISALLKNNGFIKFLQANKSVWTLCISNQFLEEFEAVAKRPKFKKYFSQQRVDKFLILIQNLGLLYENIPAINKFIDPKDEYSLDLCCCANADFLITGDKSLLELEKIKDTRIISLAHFKELWKK